MGIKTNRDYFLIDFDKQEVTNRISDLANQNVSDDEIRRKYNLLETPYWNNKRERSKVREVDWRSNIKPILYRPFDSRWIMYQQNLIEIGRGGAGTAFTKHLLAGENLCLGLGRQGLAVNDDTWNLITVSDKLVDANAFRRGCVTAFPLYLYPTEKRGLFDEPTSWKEPNLSSEFVGELFAKLKSNFKPEMAQDAPRLNKAHLGSPNAVSFSPEHIFYYAYAVFHSPTYRARYAEFLKIDFPRLPITSNYRLFFELARFGEQLVDLHLLEKDIETDVTFPEKGTNEVEFAPKYKDEKVYINKTQYFENVPEEAWNFHIGGYQILSKWLKDRKGRTLDFDDLEHYAKVVSALSQTLRLMQRIDGAIEENGGFPIE